MGLLYFIPARRFPGKRVPDVIKPRRLAHEGALSLEDIGLAHLDGAPLSFRGVAGAGPDGGAGLVIGLRTPANETGYWGETQTWKPVDGGSLYLGWSTEGGQPGPDAFLRADAVRGEVGVKMADGHVWEFVSTSPLPVIFGVGDDGGEAAHTRASDGAHFTACEWLWEFRASDKGAPWRDVLIRIVTCLGARYHLGYWEFRALELFSSDMLDPILDACLGITEKKTD